jgi:hypothetical protein
MTLQYRPFPTRPIPTDASLYRGPVCPPKTTGMVGRTVVEGRIRQERLPVIA